MFRRLWEKTKTLWKLAKSERATPREIFWAIFLGSFAGCTPAIGLHTWVALGLATAFRKNRLFAWLASRISNVVLLPFIIYAEVQTAHRLRTGAFVTMDLHDLDHLIAQAKELLLDWILGTIPVGTTTGLVLGTICWLFAKRRDARVAKEAATPAPPAGLPPPSSGSPA